jgi:hypothetical protein
MIVPVTVDGVMVIFPVGVVAVLGMVNRSKMKSMFPAAPESNAVAPGVPSYVSKYRALHEDLMDAIFAVFAVMPVVIW